MEVVHFGLDNVPASDGPLSLCLGNFDGMHLGHHEVIFECVYNGRFIPSILLLDPSGEALRQLSFLQQEVLMGLEDKINYAQGSKIERCYVCHCGPEFYQLSPEAFIENILKKMNVAEVFCGSDYTFGHKGAGNSGLLRGYFVTHVVDLLHSCGEKISSTRIRSLIEEGKIEEARELLGHPYSMQGRIVEGKKRGQSLGFPTANLETAYPYLSMRSGVYYGFGSVGGLTFPAMINVGSNPTFQNDEITIETHLIGMPGNKLYGKTMYLDFYGFIREEIKFEDATALIDQLERDKAAVLDAIEGLK